MENFPWKSMEFHGIPWRFFTRVSLKDLKHRQGIDYAIILPNEETFSELLRSVKNESSQILTTVKGCGRKLIAPKMALITETNKHLTVCFSYIQGKGFLFVVTNI